MTPGFRSGYTPFITLSAAILIALRYAYVSGYNDPLKMRDRMLREMLLAVAEEDDYDEGNDVNGVTTKNEMDESDRIKEQRGDGGAPDAAENKKTRDCGEAVPPHKRREDVNCSASPNRALTRGRRLSQKVERRIYELGMDAAGTGRGSAVWVDRE